MSNAAYVWRKSWNRGPRRDTCSFNRRLEVSLHPVRVAERPALRALPHIVVRAEPADLDSELVDQ